MLAPLLMLGLAQATSRTPEIAAWEKLKYGMFIHYGMSTFDRSEINDGKSEPSVYAPTALDVRQWVHVAKMAGMKYAVLTAKHTAGFCLWPSGDYDVTESPVKTDVVADFMKACKAEGIKPGIYYCVMDGHREGAVKWEAGVSDDYYDLIKKHLTQLHTRYPGIFEQWLDVPGKMTPTQRSGLYALVKKLNPKCLVLMNVSVWTAPGTAMPPGAWPTDLAVGERNVPPGGHNPHMVVDGKEYYLPLEVCDVIAQNWFWVPTDVPRSVRRLYGLYHSTIDRGANLLLDVPPDKTGRIPEDSIKRLMELKKAIDKPSLLDHSKSLTFRKPTQASNVYHGAPQWGPDKAVDDDDSTRWACDDEKHSATLDVDLGRAQTFSQAYVSEAYPNRVQSFALEALQGDRWVPFYRGTTIGADLTIKFKPVTAQKVRLDIQDSKIGPTIWEFQLYK